MSTEENILARETAIVIPAYNEEKRIGRVLDRIYSVNRAYFVIVINDGSKDNTAAVAIKHGATVIDRKQNSGKGTVARIGCDLARNKNYKYIILMDADGQHQPEDIPRVQKQLQKADIVYTYRVGKGKQPWIYRLGNWGLSMLSWMFFGVKIKDTQCGMRGFTKKAYEQVRWESSGFSLETEIIAKSKNLRYREIPIKKIYEDEHKENGKGTRPHIGIKIFWDMVKWKIKGVKK
ncbi:MAG: glycosyltransferase family 2 protein [Candidatus Woesearchaeota archaeon]